MNITEILNRYTTQGAEEVLSESLGKPKEFLYLHPEYILTDEQVALLEKNIRRLENGEPLAYILGFKYFYGLKIKVKNSVLIPRPETEQLVDLAVTELRKYKEDAYYLDMATGSGCVSIAVSKQMEASRVHIIASDISSDALEVAEENAKNFGVSIEFVQSDLFENIEGEFDLITANLPYVPASRLQKLSPALSFEPLNALTDGGDEWQMYEKFFCECKKYLTEKGVCILEIDEESREVLSQYIEKFGPWTSYEFLEDFRGLTRFVVVRV